MCLAQGHNTVPAVRLKHFQIFFIKLISIVVNSLDTEVRPCMQRLIKTSLFSNYQNGPLV